MQEARRSPEGTGPHGGGGAELVSLSEDLHGDGLRDWRSQKWKFREAEVSESCREDLHNA